MHLKTYNLSIGPVIREVEQYCERSLPLEGLGLWVEVVPIENISWKAEVLHSLFLGNQPH